LITSQSYVVTFDISQKYRSIVRFLLDYDHETVARCRLLADSMDSNKVGLRVSQGALKAIKSNSCDKNKNSSQEFSRCFER